MRQVWQWVLSLTLASATNLVVMMLMARWNHAAPAPPPPPKAAQVIEMPQTVQRPKPRPKQARPERTRPSPAQRKIPEALGLSSPIPIPDFVEAEEDAPEGLLRLPVTPLRPGSLAAPILSEDQIDRPPRALTNPPPAYPKAALNAGIEGVVQARVLLDAQGRVERVRILSAKPPGVFDSATEAALRRWIFEPATTRGRPTRAWVRQRVVFQLD